MKPIVKGKIRKIRGRGQEPGSGERVVGGLGCDDRAK